MPVSTPRTKKYFSKYKEPLAELPNLVETQLDSFRQFLSISMEEAVREFSPISDYSEKKFTLEFLDLTLDDPKFDEYHAKENKLSYTSDLKVRVKLHNKTLGSTHEQEIFLTEIPMMTDHGTFVVNGVERVIVPQLARSYGIFFTESESSKEKPYFGAKIIPVRGAWVEIETDKDNVMYVRIDKKRKFSYSTLLRVFGFASEKDLLAICETDEEKKAMSASIAKDTAKSQDDSYLEIHKRLRDGEKATIENAKEFVDGIFGSDRYDLSRVGRYHYNKRFGFSLEDKIVDSQSTLTQEDLVMIFRHIVKLNTTPESRPDDIDHLGLRRVKYVGELLQAKMRTGLAQMKRNIQDKMSTIDTETTLPIQIINQRPLQARVKEFFTTNQLSQFMSQENVLGEIEDLRKLSALGPGGLTRERAGFEVRDVHPSHYGRVCPIHTPEGPNIGLILHLATYARINHFGMIETPYIRVKNGKITQELDYLNAMDEERFIIAHSGNILDTKGAFVSEMVEIRTQGNPGMAKREEVNYIDVASNQAFSVATSLVPFLEHDAANRALMGSNMQKQATPCIIPQAPLVATGMEERAAYDTGRLVIAKHAGMVKAVDARKIIITTSKGDESYKLINFVRTNNYSMFHQRPVVSVGQSIQPGDLLADCSTTDGGQLAIGQNIFVAFMCWSGANYEDAIIISERLVKNSIFTSVRIEEYECIVRDTKLGEEVTTHDIPNVGESKLKNLDEEGIIRIGAEVRENDILVGKITPKGETELTPEERLLRSLFGEKARDVKDTSLRIDHGKKGRVVGVKVFSRDKGQHLESGVLKKIYIEIAQIRNVQVGDKLAGRHGNKGVISTVLKEEDMPYMEDGTPVDLILTPLGVPGRMNLGQILEMHLGFAAYHLNYQAIVPPFAGATPEEVMLEIEKAGFKNTGKVKLFDGRTGEAFDQEIAVGYMYMLKLQHMVEDKMHARSVGPYSLITQQPLGGKSQSGGQRFGEMEVWALEGYGAAYTLREMLTVKSDDIMGRSQAFDSIIRGQNIKEPNAPASFKVLLHYLRGLALDVQVAQNNIDITHSDSKVDSAEILPEPLA